MSSRSIVCPGCSCLCDGLTTSPKSASSSSSNIPEEILECSVGSKWFADRNATPEVNFDETAKVKKLLESSRSPLITGVANLTTESQQLAVRVADRYFAGIDTDWSNAGRGSMAAFQRYGKVTATLGEIANRSDLVVLWYCDPMMTHPRFVSRFLRQPGMPKKHLIVVDEKENSTCEFADEFISLSADRASEFVLDLRKSIGQNEPSKLTSQLLDSSYGCVVLGKPSGADAAFGIATDQWFQLVRSLNDHTRFVMSSLRNDRNGIGANGILTSMSGFPDSVRFTEEGPLWNGLEYSTANVVARRECDLLVVCDLGVGEPFESRLDGPTIEWLKTIPVIALSDFPANKYSTVDVHVPAGTPGWSKAGDFVRMDDVPIPMQAVSGVELTAIGDLFHGLLGDGDNSLGV